MEETTPTSTAPRPVMDIRPQRPAPQPVQRPVPAASLNRPSSFVAPSPVAEPPAQTSSLSIPQTEGPDTTNFVPQTPTAVKLPLKPKAPIAAIIIALIVAAGLIGLSVFIYLKTQQTVVPANNTATTEEHTDAPSTGEIDSANESIDAELNGVNDDADFDSNDLNDDTLGL